MPAGLLVRDLGPTFSLPLIPTPPVTIRAPAFGVVDPVVPITFKPVTLKVFPRALIPESTYAGVEPIEALLLEPVK